MRKVLSIVGVLWLLSGMTAQAATFHVAKNGTGTCPTASTLGGAVGTIVAGIYCATPGAGDTVIIHAGTYQESWSTRDQGIFPAGASTSARTTIKAAPGETVIWSYVPGCVWDPPNGPTQFCAFTLYLQSSSEFFISFQNIIFDGISRTNLNGNMQLGDVSTEAACGGSNPMNCDPHDIEFINCEWRNWHGEIGVQGRNYLFSGGSMHDGTDASGFRHFMYPGVTDFLIVENMTFYNSLAGFAIHQYHGEPVNGGPAPGFAASNLIIRGNTFHDMALGSITLANDSGTKIYNNVAYNNGSSFVNIGHTGTSEGVQIWNNTIDHVSQSASEGALFYDCGASNPTVVNNIMWRTVSGNDLGLQGCWGGSVPGRQDHNTFSNGNNPQFLGTGPDPYQLTAASTIAINLGATGGPAVTDKRGASRAGAPDIGAYEFGGTVAVPVKDTYFISPTGANTSDCVAARGTLAAPSTSPMPNFATVMPCMAAGSTLIMRGGIYPTGLNIPTPGGTDWGNPLTIQAYANPTPEVVTIQDTTAPLYLNTATDQFIVLTNLIFDAQNTNIDAVRLDNVHDYHFQNCEIKNGLYHAVSFHNATQVTFANSNLHNSVNAPIVVLDGTTNVSFTGSQITFGAGAGIVLDINGQPNTNLLIEKSTIANNAGGGIDLSTGSGTFIANNLIYSNGTTNNGIRLGSGETTAQIYYNTIWNNTAGCMLFAAGVTSSQATNNICWQSPTITNTAGIGSTTNQITDPSFAGVTPGTPATFLHLGSTSTARDTGTPIGAVTTDRTGKTRPAPGTSGVDKGAFEEDPVAGPASPAPPLVSPYKTTQYHYQW